MRNIFIPIVVSCLIFFSYNKNSKITDTKITIAGKLENSGIPVIIVSQEFEEVAKDSLQADGSFVLTFDYEEADFYLVRNGNSALSLYLNPGDSIFITGDYNNFEQTFDASGDMALENKFHFQKDRFFFNSGLTDYYRLMGLDKDAYFFKKDSILSLAKTLLDQLHQTEGIDTSFLALEESEFNFQNIFLDQLYPMYHALANNIPQDSVVFPIEGSNKKVEMLPMDRVEHLQSDYYAFLISSRIDSLANRILKTDTSLKFFEQAEWIAIDSLISLPEMRDFFRFKSIKRTMEFRGPIHVEENYNKFTAENTSPKYAKRLEKIKSTWEPISLGKTVPDFEFTDINGNSVKLSGLKGKLVYIDIWATWCGPCIEEHPFWNEVKEEFKAEPVEFLSISIDDTREPWEKMVKNKKMQGLQWFAANAWESEFTKFFMVNSIPRFILLNKEGKIIDPSTDQPSGNIREILNTNLKR